MATYTVKARKHAQLMPGVVDTVNVSTVPSGQVTVTNRDGTAEITFVAGNNPPDPVVGQDETFLLPAQIGSTTVGLPGGPAVAVKLISGGSPKYSVSIS